jgi:hypothetical protein
LFSSDFDAGDKNFVRNDFFFFSTKNTKTKISLFLLFRPGSNSRLPDWSFRFRSVLAKKD